MIIVIITVITITIILVVMIMIVIKTCMFLVFSLIKDLKTRDDVAGVRRTQITIAIHTQ